MDVICNSTVQKNFITYTSYKYPVLENNFYEEKESEKEKIYFNHDNHILMYNVEQEHFDFKYVIDLYQTIDFNNETVCNI